MVDWPTLFGLACLAASSALSLWIASLREELHRHEAELKILQQALTTLREIIPQRYATVDDLKELGERGERQGERIFATLQRIEVKLDTKQDKT